VHPLPRLIARLAQQAADRAVAEIRARPLAHWSHDIIIGDFDEGDDS
jgi:hypothetical protein